MTASVQRIHKWIIQQWCKWETERKKGGRLGEWCSWVKSLWVSVVITDISSGFSVFENDSKSRLQPDGHPCNHSSNSICSVIERQCSLSACLLKEWHTAWILTSHWRTEIATIGINVGHWKWNLAGLHTTWIRLINTLMATPTWASAPAMGNQNGLHANRYEDGNKLKRK